MSHGRTIGSQRVNVAEGHGSDVNVFQSNDRPEMVRLVAQEAGPRGGLTQAWMLLSPREAFELAAVLMREAEHAFGWSLATGRNPENYVTP